MILKIDIYPQKMLKQEELVDIIDTTGPGSLVFGEEHEVTMVDIASSFENYIFLAKNLHSCIKPNS